MDTMIVIEQMLIIFMLIIIGFILHRTKLLAESTSKQISGIILNVTNPALLLSSSLSDEKRMAISEIGTGLIYFIAMYIFLILFALIIPIILKIEKSKRYSYIMMSIFGNVGFIGIPLATEVLGADSLIYISICNLLYSILFYTFGISVFENTKNKYYNTETCNTNNDKCDNTKNKFKLPGWINIGTVSAALTIALYITNVKLTGIVGNVLSYAGRSTTFLSMIVLGVSVSTMNYKKVLTNIKLYIFIAIRLIIVPILMISLFRLFTNNELLINSLTIMVSISFGNMPLMMSLEYGFDTEDISGGIILSTIMSLATIPIVSIITSLLV